MLPKYHVHSANVRFKKGTDKIEVYCENPECDWIAVYDPESITHSKSWGDAVKNFLATKK